MNNKYSQEIKNKATLLYSEGLSLRKVGQELNIPVFHDDQHGTAIVVLAGIINALKVAGKNKETAKVVVNGGGSAGLAITKLLLYYGFKDVTVVDRYGILDENADWMNWAQKEVCKITNPRKLK